MKTTGQCLVKSNCSHNWECSWCQPGYKDYQPIDKRILSPAQIDKKEKRKADKKDPEKEKKRKQGKQNRRSGKYAENGAQKLLESWGIPVGETVMSGQLKASKVVGKSKEHRELFEGDKWPELLGKKRCLENKKRTLKDFGRYYNRLEDDKVLVVKGSFVMMNQETFHQLYLGVSVPYEEIEDKGFKFIHDSFAQDDAEIVTLVSKMGDKNRYLPYIFCLSYSLWEEFLNGTNGR